VEQVRPVGEGRVISQIPGAGVVVPERVQTMAGQDVVRPVWVNELGGTTFELTAGAGRRRFVKWNPHGTDIDLAAEAARLRWAVAHARVPRVLELDSDDDATWLVTEGLPGRSAVDGRWVADPATAVAALGVGLRALHDALPVPACPFTWSDEERLAAAHRRADADARAARGGDVGTGAVGPERARWHPVHSHLTWDDALRLLADPPPPDRSVVCHGDSCAPNTLLTDDGRWSGHVDLGRLGVADRWADLAVAAWSTDWNYGPSWEGPLLDAYGIEPDPARLAFYRLLWDLS